MSLEYCPTASRASSSIIEGATRLHAVLALLEERDRDGRLEKPDLSRGRRNLVLNGPHREHLPHVEGRRPVPPPSTRSGCRPRRVRPGPWMPPKAWLWTGFVAFACSTK